MGSLRFPQVDRREAAIAAAISGAAFIVVGYGTGLGISNVADASASFTRPTAPPPSAIVVPPSPTLPTIATPPVTPPAAAAAPILSAPRVVPRPVIIVVMQQSSPSLSCPTAAPPDATGLLSGLDLASLTRPVTNLLGTLPLVGSLLGQPVAASLTCPPKSACCPTARTASRR